MRPKSLSASAAGVYELCPSRYATEIILRPPSSSGSAANLGTACHRVFQLWIDRDLYNLYPSPPDDDAKSALRVLWDETYWDLFADAARYDEGLRLCERWLERQVWTSRTVLTTEHKESFNLDTSAGLIPFNYIMDRVDRHDDGDIEVIDYKSVSFPVQPEELKVRIQSRAYALAAHLKYPDAKRIWVTFDLLRFDPIGIVFTRDEAEETLAYLHALAERILADNDPIEQLNPECRWCLRKTECKTLQEHVVSAGRKLHFGTIDEAVERRAELDYAEKAIKAQLSELDALIMAHLTTEGIEELSTGPYTVGLTSSRRRQVDAQGLAQLLPYEVFAPIASISVTGLDDLLKGGGVDAETASLIRRCVAWRYGAKSLSFKRTKVR